jgi:hypothetical protein
MENKETNPETGVGAIQKRREKMADEKRYIIYYTFDEAEKTPETLNEEVKKNV